MPHAEAEDAAPRRVLIYRCGTLGDTIVALPAIDAVRATYPGARYWLMTACTEDGKLWASDVLAEFGWFAGALTYAPADLRRVRSLRRLIAEVRSYGFDLVVHMGTERNSPLRLLRDRLFFRLTGVKRVWCCPSEKVGWLGRESRACRIYPTEVERLLGHVRAHGCSSNGTVFALPIAQTARARVETLLHAGLREPTRPLVGMCPGSKQPIKRWPVERFGEVGRRLIEEMGVNIAVVGGPEESEIAAVISARWPTGRWLDAANRLRVLESAELLRRCRLYVGNDTGAMHLAAASGTPCAAIFCARTQGRSWYPHGDNHVVLRKNVSCQNCLLDECRDEGLRCLTSISTDDVMRACQRILFFG